MPSVLFVCTANQFRSPMAAACLREIMDEERAAEHWMVESAGTWTREGMPAAKIAVETARQIGVYGLRGHRTRQISSGLLNRFDLVIVMERGHKEAIASEFPSVRRRLFLLSEVVDDASYDIPDPGERGPDPHEIGRELCSLVTKGKEKILHLAASLSRTELPSPGNSRCA
jgi:protein-tyrosine phosphatase